MVKSQFSKTWKASKQPRKQRKYSYNAPLHIKHKMLSSTLDKPLREKYERRSLEVRKGDVVKVMRGKLKGKQGKVSIVDTTRERVSIEGLERAKKEGTKVPTWFNASKVKIIELEGSDQRRLKSKPVKQEKKPEQGKEKEPAKKQVKQNKEKK